MSFVNRLIDDVPNEKHAKHAAHILFIIITSTIFIVEFLIMMLLSVPEMIFPLKTVFLDSTIITIITSPPDIFFLCKAAGYKYLKAGDQPEKYEKCKQPFKSGIAKAFKVLDGLPASVHLLDANHKVRFANKYFKENFGEINEQPCYKLLHGSDTACDVCSTFEVFHKNNPHDREIKRTNGKIYSTYNYPFVDIDGSKLVLQLGIDITDRKKAEQELFQRERELSLIINSTSDTIYMLDTDECITAIYGDGLKKLGLSPDHYIGKKINELFEPERSAQFHEVFELVKNGKDAILSWEAQLQTGNMFFHNSFSPVFNKDKEVIGIIGIARNITQEKILEKKIIETEKLMTLAQMTAMISHEFRNSLTSLRMILELLQESKEVKNLHEQSVSVALDSVTSMEDIVTQMLAFSRPSKVILQKQKMENIVDQSILLVEPQLKKYGIEVIKEYDSKLPVIKADPVKLKEAFVNLLLNAVMAIKEYSGNSKKKIWVSVTYEKLKKAVWNKCLLSDENSGEFKLIWEDKLEQIMLPGSNCLQVVFKDSGSGIDAENLDKVFTPFFTTRTTGTGLGLATVKRTISSHNAVIILESIKNQGTTFRIFFPV